MYKKCKLTLKTKMLTHHNKGEEINKTIAEVSQEEKTEFLQGQKVFKKYGEEQLKCQN